MAAKNPRRRVISSTISATKRHHGSDHESLGTLYAELREVGAEDAVRRIVDSAPPLSDDQRARLALILLRGTT